RTADPGQGRPGAAHRLLDRRRRSRAPAPPALLPRNTADLSRCLTGTARRHRLAGAVRDSLRGPRHPRLLRVGRPRIGGPRAPRPSRVRASQSPQHRRARGTRGWSGGGPQLVPVVNGDVENPFAIISGGRDRTGHAPTVSPGRNQHHAQRAQAPKELRHLASFLTELRSSVLPKATGRPNPTT